MNKYTVIFKNSGSDSCLEHVFSETPKDAIKESDKQYANKWHAELDELDNYDYIVFDEHITPLIFPK